MDEAFQPVRPTGGFGTAGGDRVEVSGLLPTWEPSGAPWPDMPQWYGPCRGGGYRAVPARQGPGVGDPSVCE
jgi:hypothetical protein